VQLFGAPMSSIASPEPRELFESISIDRRT
jgi:hypothetical protein